MKYFLEKIKTEIAIISDNKYVFDWINNNKKQQQQQQHHLNS